jgi:UDP-N-acetyl-D-mannosaminuronic acid transferase (WecB/TagA/CpsF family)
LGVKFFVGSIADACDRAARGGLVLAPSGPGLSHDLVKEPIYREALESSDLVLTDSGWLVLLWWLRTGRRLPRNSGLAFLRVAMRNEMEHHNVFWVMPSEEEKERSLAWLKTTTVKATPDDCYVAPYYGGGPIVDFELLKQIEMRQPTVVVIAIGGGVQERLGLYLKDHLSYRPGIFCLGAAIAFMSGGQVHIPNWVDRWMLGWLWRIMSNPVVYAPRYWRALRLGSLVFRFGSQPLPPFKAPRAGRVGEAPGYPVSVEKP